MLTIDINWGVIVIWVNEYDQLSNCLNRLIVEESRFV
jgi:hypothetical protein